MKSLEFPAITNPRVEWNEYRRFFVPHFKRRFIQFDTGEFIITAGYWPARDRMEFRNLGLSLVYPRDPELKGVTFTDPVTDRLVSKAHLAPSDALMIDHTTDRAYHVPHRSRFSDPRVPPLLRTRAYVYFSGPGEEPAAAPVPINSPMKLDLDTQRELRQRRQVAKAAHALGAYDGASLYYPPTRRVDHTAVLIDDWQEVMAVRDKHALAVNGFEIKNEFREVPYLKVNFNH